MKKGRVAMLPFTSLFSIKFVLHNEEPTLLPPEAHLAKGSRTFSLLRMGPKKVVPKPRSVNAALKW